MARNPRNRTTQQPSQQPPPELNFRFSNRPSRSNGVPSLLDYSGIPQHLAQGHPPTYTANQQYGRPQPYTSAQFANSVGIQPEIEGYGTLKWLSARAGVMITPDGKMVSFQEKEFCQKSIADLRAVLRVGLMLNFRAKLSVPTSNQYVATSVLPIVGPQADAIFKDAHEIDLDPSLAESTHQSPRYSKILEYETYSIVLMPFAHSRRDTVQLGSIITELNQFGNQEVLEYVGSSVQKRKIFLEQRTHLLKFGHGTVMLQHPAIHNAVVQLASFLLRRGGVTSINDLYEFFCSHTEQWIGEHIGHVYSDFTAFLKTQPFAFALFENFVSARRNFPDFDYLGFIQTYFPTMIRPEERHEDVHYYHQPSHHNEMGMYQQSMVMAHQSSYAPAESVARHSLSSYTPHGSSSTSSQRSGSIFRHSMEPHSQNVLTNTQMQLEPPLNYSDNFPRNSSTSEFTSSIFMDPVRREDQTPPNGPLKLPNNFPSIPEILAMGDKVMRGFSLPEVNPEPSSSQKENDELCAEFEAYLQVVQAKESKQVESSSTRIGHPNCTCIIPPRDCYGANARQQLLQAQQLNIAGYRLAASGGSATGSWRACRGLNQRSEPNCIHPLDGFAEFFDATTIETPIEGYGILTQLTQRAGVITNNDGKKISFQANVFCDLAVTDLRSVLFVGFTLQFTATPCKKDPNTYTASEVSPVHGEEVSKVFWNSSEVDMHTEETWPHYDETLEGNGYHTLLRAFLYYRSRNVQFRHINHYLTHNCKDEMMRQYIGRLPKQQRNFMQSRCHMFYYDQVDDSFNLQHPDNYDNVVKLSTYLLSHGGCASVWDLYTYYLSLYYPGIKDNKDDNSAHFQELKYILACNAFAFNCFPSGEYVSARHNLPHFDYMSYIEAIHPEVLEMEKHEHPEGHLMPVSETPVSSGTSQPNSLDIDEYLAMEISQKTPLFTEIMNMAPRVANEIRPVIPLHPGGPFTDFATEFGRFMDLKRDGKLEDFLKKTECTCDCGCGTDHDAAAAFRTSLPQ